MRIEIQGPVPLNLQISIKGSNNHNIHVIFLIS